MSYIIEEKIKKLIAKRQKTAKIKGSVTLTNDEMTQISEVIMELEKENHNLYYKLQGVMWSVDKWLSDEELDQDEVNRAATMREKTLRIVEGLERQVSRLAKQLPTKKTCGNCVYSKPTTFGRSKVYVECQNPVHVAVYCRQGKSSHKRSRSTLACKSWERRSEDIK